MFLQFRQLTGPVKPDTSPPKLFGKNHPKTFRAVRRNYYLMYEARAWLRHVISLGTTPRGVSFGLASSEVSLTAHLDERGQVRFDISPIVEALDGIEGARIRECPICGRFFWASRKDKPCCGAKCANSLRARRWRRDYKQRYKEARVKRAEQKAMAEREQQLRRSMLSGGR